MGRYSVPLAPLFADFAGAEGRVLDVGCGPGALTAELVQRLGEDAVSAVDPSQPFVDAVRERHPGVTVERAAAEELPFAEREFDAALAQLVVHFMTDPVAGLREMARVTRDGGVVAATRVGSRRRPGPAERVLGGCARARSRRRGRVKARRRTRRRSDEAVPDCGTAGDRRDRALGRRRASDLRGLVGAVHAGRRTRGRLRHGSR